MKGIDEIWYGKRKRRGDLYIMTTDWHDETTGVHFNQGDIVEYQGIQSREQIAAWLGEKRSEIYGRYYSVKLVKSGEEGTVHETDVERVRG